MCVKTAPETFEMISYGKFTCGAKSTTMPNATSSNAFINKQHLTAIKQYLGQISEEVSALDQGLPLMLI